MKSPLSVFCSTVLLWLGCACSSPAAICLDDTWADGTRTDQNLPEESAWFASSGSQLTAATNVMTLTIGSGSVMAITYFTSNAGSPVQLDLGDTLTVSLAMQFSGVASPNTSQGWRLALCDFADSTTPRLTADSYSTSSQGAGVQGYALFQNMGTTFRNASPMDIRKRTDISSSELLSATGAWTSLAAGPGNTNADPCFAQPGSWNGGVWTQGDYHLKSQGWRWNPATDAWTADDMTSPCIDAGDPSSSLANEPVTIPGAADGTVVNTAVDMGVYGGTSQASVKRALP